MHPIEVRKKGEKYEIIAGRRRWMAAKHLKWKFVQCRLINCNDDELKFMHLSENRLRRHMNEGEELANMKLLREEYDKIFGEDPGKKIGGWKRAEQAARSKDGRFQPGKKEEPQPDPEENGETDGDVELDPAFCTDEHGETLPDTPAPATVAGAGVDATKQGEKGGKKPKSARAFIGEQMGASERQTRRDKKIMDSFTADQLRILGHQGLTKKDFAKLAKIKDKEKRDVAVNKLIMNRPLEEVLAEAETEIDAELIKERQENTLSDDDWVKTYCAKPLRNLQHQKHFFDAAILYRKVRIHLAELKRRTRKDVETVHNHAANPFTWTLLSVIGIDHPDNWPICGGCLGLNRENPTCDECKGFGFTLRIEWPKRDRR
jgi:hypothetical protein